MKKFNAYLATKYSSILLAVMVIAGELYKPFKTAIASITGHHWKTKAIIIPISYLVIGLMGKKKISSKNALTWVVISLFVILAYYFIHFASGE